MDTGNMTFQEILFNGRYHIIGGVMFLVFMAAFMREIVSELTAAVSRASPRCAPALPGHVHVRPDAGRDDDRRRRAGRRGDPQGPGTRGQAAPVARA